MPAKSDAQRAAAGAALDAKRKHKTPPKGSASASMAKGMNEKQLRDYAKKPKRK
jgi:hypothetical protein